MITHLKAIPRPGRSPSLLLLSTPTKSLQLRPHTYKEQEILWKFEQLEKTVSQLNASWTKPICKISPDLIPDNWDEVTPISSEMAIDVERLIQQGKSTAKTAMIAAACLFAYGALLNALTP